MTWILGVPMPSLTQAEPASVAVEDVAILIDQDQVQLALSLEGRSEMAKFDVPFTLPSVETSLNPQNLLPSPFRKPCCGFSLTEQTRFASRLERRTGEARLRKKLPCTSA